MQIKPRSTRAIALLTGATLAATAFFQPAPARADKAQTYKYGAIGLGVLGAYFLSKGKTLPGAAAVAGGLYAYKKGRSEQKAERYDQNRYDNGNYRRRATSSDYYANSRDNNGRRENQNNNRNHRRSGTDNYDLSPYLR